ncbi:hypothetical protein [Rhizobium leguminosarum]|uniref:hypothetical protein n=1 Tax=Rhizobium leguminosarum TaxID=384 RepID=UPI0013EF2883|nr:hypothetical protein [Rhizobium leguminosarum]
MLRTVRPHRPELVVGIADALGDIARQARRQRIGERAGEIVVGVGDADRAGRFANDIGKGASKARLDLFGEAIVREGALQQGEREEFQLLDRGEPVCRRRDQPGAEAVADEMQADRLLQHELRQHAFRQRLADDAGAFLHFVIGQLVQEPRHRRSRAGDQARDDVAEPLSLADGAFEVKCRRRDESFHQHFGAGGIVRGERNRR